MQAALQPLSPYLDRVAMPLICRATRPLRVFCMDQTSIALDDHGDPRGSDLLDVYLLCRAQIHLAVNPLEKRLPSSILTASHRLSPRAEFWFNGF